MFVRSLSSMEVSRSTMSSPLPQQSGYRKRVKAAAGLITAVTQALARQTPSNADTLRLIDATAVACGASRQTTRRSALAGHASYGYCRSHSR
ncbi:hypothetical protein [Longispora urticae]